VKPDGCQLFNVECDVGDGFTVSIDRTCKISEYNYLPTDNAGIFMFASETLPNDAETFATNSSCNFDGKCNGVFLGGTDFCVS